MNVRATAVVPTLNERDNLEPLFRRLCAACPSIEIVVVDDGSADGTPERARELARSLPVRVVERPGERDLATAVLRGVREARTDICVVMDADLSHPPEAVPALVRAVEEGADIAVGSRYVPGGGSEDWPLARRIVSRAGALLARPLAPVRDPLAGFFCLRRRLLEDAPLRVRGFKLLLEILAQTRTSRVVEVPIVFRDRRAGRSKLGARQAWAYLAQLTRLYRTLDARLLAQAVAVGGALGLAACAALVGGRSPDAERRLRPSTDRR